MNHGSKAHFVGRLVAQAVVGLGLLFTCTPAQADEIEHRLGAGVPMAVGIGIEVSRGDYDTDADATVTTLPVLVMIQPLDTLDLTLEVPLVRLRSHADSGMVVTGSGGGTGMTTPAAGMDRGRRPGRPMSRPAAGMMPPGGTMMPPAGMATETVTESGLGDISLQAGWTLLHDDGTTPKLRPTFYLKVPNGDDARGLGTGTFEGGPGLFVSKWLGDWQLFAEGAWIFQNSTDDYAGKNYVSYGAGGGMQITDRLFASLFAKGSSARFEGGEAPAEGWLKLNFLQSRRLSWEAYVLTGFSDASPDTGGGLLVIYQF